MVFFEMINMSLYDKSKYFVTNDFRNMDDKSIRNAILLSNSHQYSKRYDYNKLKTCNQQYIIVFFGPLYINKTNSIIKTNRQYYHYLTFKNNIESQAVFDSIQSDINKILYNGNIIIEDYSKLYIKLKLKKFHHLIYNSNNSNNSNYLKIRNHLIWISKQNLSRKIITHIQMAMCLEYNKTYCFSNEEINDLVLVAKLDQELRKILVNACKYSL
jgi:hypothetical protein